MRANHPLNRIEYQVMWNRLISVVEEQAQTRFYQNLAAATRMFIERDFDQCRGDVPVLVSGSASA